MQPDKILSGLKILATDFSYSNQRIMAMGREVHFYQLPVLSTFLTSPTVMCPRLPMHCLSNTQSSKMWQTRPHINSWSNYCHCSMPFPIQTIENGNCFLPLKEIEHFFIIFMSGLTRGPNLLRSLPASLFVLQNNMA